MPAQRVDGTAASLRSGHNNPNPNFVYWVDPLSERQYTKLVKFLDAYRGGVFRPDQGSRWPGYTLLRLTSPRVSPQPPERMTPESAASWRTKSDAVVDTNLRRILRELNRALSQEQTFRLDAAINRYPNVVKIADPE